MGTVPYVPRVLWTTVRPGCSPDGAHVPHSTAHGQGRATSHNDWTKALPEEAGPANAVHTVVLDGDCLVLFGARNLGTRLELSQSAIFDGSSLMNLPTLKNGTRLSSTNRRTWRRVTPRRSASWSMVKSCGSTAGPVIGLLLGRCSYL